MGKRRRKNRGPFLWGLFLLSFSAGLISALYLVRFGWLDEFIPVRERVITRYVPAPKEPPEAKPPEARPPVARVPGRVDGRVDEKRYAKVAIVIDDMGQDMKGLRGLLEVNAPITIAVLPHLKFSREVAREASLKGREVLLHLPMEPKGTDYNNPGEGALLTAMNEEDIRSTIAGDLMEVPGAVGVNNHMGSRFTEDEARMRAVLDVVRKNKLFFLDSRTSSMSVGTRLAKEMGIKNIGRNVFLDNNRDHQYIKAQLKELVAIAKKKGKAVGIGHPYPETIEVLQEMVPELKGQGVTVVKLSELVE